MDTSAKHRNIGINPNVAFVVDDVVSEEPAECASWHPPPGRADLGRVDTDSGPEPADHPHPPSPGFSRNVDTDHPGPRRATSPCSTNPKAAGPTLGADDATAQETVEAVGHFVEELQVGSDEHDTNTYNQHFADDALPGGEPFRRDRSWLQAAPRHPWPPADGGKRRAFAHGCPLISQ
jgi:hypothetical protein